MTFEQIFEEDGKYVAEDFMPGVCLLIKEGTMYLLTYRNRNDFTPSQTDLAAYRGLFRKHYEKVLTRQSLFDTV